MILILTKPDDTHADRVEALLLGRGLEVARLDPAERVRMVFDARRMLLQAEDRVIDLSRVRVGWYRRPNPPRASERIRDPHLRHYVELETYLYLEGLWPSLECTWVPAPYATTRQADHKLMQLAAARALGFTTPPTLITNDAAELVRFYEQHRARIISKLPGPAAYWLEPRAAARYTQPVTRGDLAAAMASLRYAPMIFQQQIDKARELRVTVVGERVFAAAVDSQRSGRTRVDYRADLRGTPHVACELPAEVAARCRALTRRLGLVYSTIDLIVTPDGDHVFLELNPNGQYLWVEEMTGTPISEAIADLLEETHG